MSAGPIRVHVPGAVRLALGESEQFELERDGEALGGFVLRHAAGLFAFLNRCPHWAVDLDLGDGRFYAADIDRMLGRANPYMSGNSVIGESRLNAISVHAH